jgi:uncharacterized protein YaiL (DUF2058 family)
MSMSLREQLLAAGLGNKQQAKKAEHEERQRARNKGAQEAKAKEQQRLAEAQAAKAARDLALNRKRELSIVRCEGRYDIVPPDVAARIGEREPRAVVSLKHGENQAAADDPYKDYVVPDDLMW